MLQNHCLMYRAKLQVHGVLGQTYSAMLGEGLRDARPEVCGPVWDKEASSGSWRRSTGVMQAVPVQHPT